MRERERMKEMKEMDTPFSLFNGIRGIHWPTGSKLSATGASRTTEISKIGQPSCFPRFPPTTRAAPWAFRNFGVLCESSFAGFLPCKRFCRTLLQNPNGSAELGGGRGSLEPSFEDRLFLPELPWKV